MPNAWTELKRLVDHLRRQGLILTFWAGVDKVYRWITGRPVSRFSRITPRLWLGGQPSSQGLGALIEEGFTGFVNMRSEFDYEHLFEGDRVRYLHLPTDDNEAPTLDHLSAGVDFIRAEADRGGKVYIHCWEGLGRGPTMAAAYFVSRGAAPEEAWARIRAVRPFVRPTERQLKRLRTFAARYQPGEALRSIEHDAEPKTQRPS